MENQLDFERIHSAFRPKILRYLTRMVGEHEAEDLTQDVFVKVVAALKSFRGESQISTWIYRVASNTALDRLRSPSFKRSVVKGSPEDPFARVEIDLENKDAWTGEAPPTPDAMLIKEEMNDCIRNFIEELPPDYRTVLVLSELEELKDHKIAQILGISLASVKIRLHRARARLKKELELRCTIYRDGRRQLACDLKEAIGEFRKAN